MLEKKRFFEKNFASIFVLGMSAGLPLALVLSSLKAVLSDKGFDLRVIGFLSLVSLPYAIKFLFAPIIDSLKIPLLDRIFGQRKSWIILMQLSLSLTIATLGVFLEAKNLAMITIFASLTAFFSANQDIVIDGFRIELFDEKNQGLGASFYIFGYRIGMLISGALALFLADKMSWDLVYFAMAFCMLFFAFCTLFTKETRKNFVAKSDGFIAWFKNYVILPFLDFTKKSKWYVILLFVICFKLGDAFAGSLAMPFFLDLGFSKTQIAAIVKTFGLFATLFGVFIGGFLAKKLDIYKALLIAIIVQSLSNLVFAFLAKIGFDIGALYLTIFIENLSGGIGDAIFVAYLSMLCNINFSATQFAILSSFASLSRALFSSSAGVVAFKFGWYKFFIFSTFLALPTLIFWIVIKKTLSKNAST